MTTHPALTKAGQQYAKAYSTHYVTKDLPGAMELYRGVMAAFPESPEAGYSRSQIKGIVTAVVPEQVLLDANVLLAKGQFLLRKKPGTRPTPSEQAAGESPE